LLAGNVPQHYLTKKLPEDWTKTPVKVNFMLQKGFVCLYVCSFCLSVFLSLCLSVFLSFCFLIFWREKFRSIISLKSCRKIGTRLPLRFVLIGFCLFECLFVCLFFLSFVFLFSEFLAGNVPQHYLTEKLPEDWNKTPVKVVFCLFVCLSV
jgi:hypothetical protein